MKRSRCIRCGSLLKKETYWYCPACGVVNNPLTPYDTRKIIEEVRDERSSKRPDYGRILYFSNLLKFVGDNKTLMKDKEWRSIMKNPLPHYCQQRNADGSMCKNIAAWKVVPKSGHEYIPVHSVCGTHATYWRKRGREVDVVRLRENPMTNVHPLAIEARNRYLEDNKAGHSAAAEYWRGQAGAFFTGNPAPRKGNPYAIGHTRQPIVGDRVGLLSRPSKGRFDTRYHGTVTGVFVLPATDELSEQEYVTVAWDGGGFSNVETKTLALISRSGNANPLPLLGTIGNAMLTGMGLGVGVSVVNTGMEKLSGKKNKTKRRNPRQ